MLFIYSPYQCVKLVDFLLHHFISEVMIMHFQLTSMSVRTVCLFQALVGEKACYQSVSSYAGQIIYLGTKVLARTFRKPFCSICGPF